MAADTQIQGHGPAHRDAARQGELAGDVSATEHRHPLTLDVSNTKDVAVQLGELVEHGVRIGYPEELEDDLSLAPHGNQRSVLLQGLLLDQVLDLITVLSLGTHGDRRREHVEVSSGSRNRGVPCDVVLGKSPSSRDRLEDGVCQVVCACRRRTLTRDPDDIGKFVPEIQSPMSSRMTLETDIGN